MRKKKNIKPRRKWGFKPVTRVIPDKKKRLPRQRKHKGRSE